MLGDFCAASGSNKGRCSRYIEGMRTIAASAAGIHQIRHAFKRDFG